MSQEMINTPNNMADTFNSHFASVGEKLVFDIQPSVTLRYVY